MDDKDSLLKKAEDEIKEAAKAVEDFADKVAAPEEPVIIIPAEDAPPPNPPARKDG
jgi:hypothetical protein